MAVVVLILFKNQVKVVKEINRNLEATLTPYALGMETLSIVQLRLG